jgi:hypothetical protein
MACRRQFDVVVAATADRAFTAYQPPADASSVEGGLPQPASIGLHSHANDGLDRDIWARRLRRLAVNSWQTKDLPQRARVDNECYP